MFKTGDLVKVLQDSVGQNVYNSGYQFLPAGIQGHIINKESKWNEYKVVFHLHGIKKVVFVSVYKLEKINEDW